MDEYITTFEEALKHIGALVECRPCFSDSDIPGNTFTAEELAAKHPKISLDLHISYRGRLGVFWYGISDNPVIWIDSPQVLIDGAVKEDYREEFRMFNKASELVASRIRLIPESVTDQP